MYDVDAALEHAPSFRLGSITTFGVSTSSRRLTPHWARILHRILWVLVFVHNDTKLLVITTCDRNVARHFSVDDTPSTINSMWA